MESFSNDSSMANSLVLYSRNGNELENFFVVKVLLADKENLVSKEVAKDHLKTFSDEATKGAQIRQRGLDFFNLPYDYWITPTNLDEVDWYLFLKFKV